MSAAKEDRTEVSAQRARVPRPEATDGAPAAGPPDDRPPLQKLNECHGEDWAKVEGQIPTWKEAWAPADWSSIKGDIQYIGINPLAASQMATLVKKHLNASEGTIEQLQWGSQMYTRVAASTEGAADNCGVSLIQSASPWLGASFNSPDANVLICRQWHRDFWNLFMKNGDLCKPGHRVAVIGTPGIGKTMGLNYILYKYLKMEKPPLRFVAVILPNDIEYYVFDTLRKRACRVGLRATELVQLDSFHDDVLVLHDLGKDSPLTSRNLPTVLATSPKSSKYNEFMKGSFRTFYVPLPTDAEMAFMAEHVFAGHDYSRSWPDVECKSWKDAAEYLGNVPRNVFGPPQEGLKEKIDDQIKSLDLSKLFTTAQSEATVDVNDVLVEYRPTDGSYHTKMMRFRAGYVSKQLALRWYHEKLLLWDQIVNLTSSGHAFETVVHHCMCEFMHEISTDDIQPLLSASDAPQDPAVPATKRLRELWPKNAVTAVEFSKETTVVSLETQRYYYPRVPNYPVVDSFVFVREKNSKTLNFLFFQMTITRHHGTEAAKVKLLFDGLLDQFRYKGNPLTLKIPEDNDPDQTPLKVTCGDTVFDLGVYLIYVVPSSTYGQFGYQSLQGLSKATREQEPKSSGMSAWERCWNRIHQFKSPPPLPKQLGGTGG